MGTGKSTLGRALAARTGATFIDLDCAAERELGCTAAAAFAVGREADFRRAEAGALEAVCRDAAEGRRVVVACGGGTPCFGTNMERMLEAGTVVCLTCCEERLLPRLELAIADRPVLRGLTGTALLEHVRRLQADRAAAYARAHATFDASYLENESEIAATTTRFIEAFLDNH